MSIIEQQIHYNSEYQKELWNRQHSERGSSGGRENIMRFDPNESAVKFEEIICEKSHILEIGSGNGRDARYWAQYGHTVSCIDFSDVALNQLIDTAAKQGVDSKLIPILHDISSGDLPESNHFYDAFYSRSALHVGDQEMFKLADQIDKKLKPNSKIMIIGKSLDDAKIQRSNIIYDNLAVDLIEDGHLRRIWTEDFIEKMCESVNWVVQSIEKTSEKINNQNTSFIKLIAEKKWINQEQ